MLFYGQIVKFKQIDDKFLVSFKVLEWFSGIKKTDKIEILMSSGACDLYSKWLVNPHWNSYLKRYYAGDRCDIITNMIVLEEEALERNLYNSRLVSRIEKQKLDTSVVLTHYYNNFSAKGAYKNGMPEGVWNYYVDNNLRSSYTYRRGIYVEITKYYSNGFPRSYVNKRERYSLRYFKTDSSVIKTKVVSFGRRKTAKTRIGNFYKMKMKVINYHKNGNITDIYFQKNYRVKGGSIGYIYKRVNYHDNGDIKSVKRYKNKKKGKT